MDLGNVNFFGMDRGGPYLSIVTKTKFIGGSVWEVLGGCLTPLVRRVAKIRRRIIEVDLKLMSKRKINE